MCLTLASMFTAGVGEVAGSSDEKRDPNNRARGLRALVGEAISSGEETYSTGARPRRPRCLGDFRGELGSRRVGERPGFVGPRVRIWGTGDLEGLLLSRPRIFSVE